MEIAKTIEVHRTKQKLTNTQKLIYQNQLITNKETNRKTFAEQNLERGFRIFQVFYFLNYRNSSLERKKAVNPYEYEKWKEDLNLLKNEISYQIHENNPCKYETFESYTQRINNAIKMKRSQSHFASGIYDIVKLNSLEEANSNQEQQVKKQRQFKLLPRVDLKTHRFKTLLSEVSSIPSKYKL